MKIKSYMITGTIFVSILGTLLHFAYNLSGNNTLIGIFTPINESTWEHTKLLFFPMLVYSLYLQRKKGAEYPHIRAAMNVSILLGVFLIIALFYTYSGIIGFNTPFVDISLFFVSVIAAFFVSYKLTLSEKIDKYKGVLMLFVIALLFMYIIFTFFPPHIPLFISPAGM